MTLRFGFTDEESISVLHLIIVICSDPPDRNITRRCYLLEVIIAWIFQVIRVLLS